MYGALQRRIRRLAAERAYVVTLHAAEEIEDDGLSISDVEFVLTIGSIAERQRDRSSGEWKYVVRGVVPNRGLVDVVVKLGPTGKLVVITVFRH